MLKSFLLIFCLLIGGLFTSPASAERAITAIEVQGNRRVETPTVMSYIDIKPGQTITEEGIEENLKNLFATGLFADVVIEQHGDKLVIRVVENKIINRIAFEGNDRLKDEIIQKEIKLRPREVYTAARVQEAAQRIRDMYRLSGRYGAKVIPKIIEREENRVDLIFEIEEGKTTKINRIIFVGNTHFTDSQLKSVILTQESKWWRFFSTDDTYDPDRLAYDKELLRRYYRENGYADFKVESVVAELDPDDQEFYITYTIDEGKRYKFGKIKILNKLKGLKDEGLKELVTFEKEDWFNSKQVEQTIDKLTDAVGERGFAFIEIVPQFKRNADCLTVDVNLVIKEGRHVYINRINIVGNDRTDDDVIRRQFRLAEGDAYNSAKIKRSEQRLRNLDFFSKVEVKQEEAGAPDKVDIKVEVEDKPTGELQFSGGYSTTDGPIASITMNERNLMGKGYDLYANATVSKRSRDFHTGFIDPYFLGKELSGGVDAFHSSRKYSTRNSGSTGYKQTKTGGAFSLGYDITEHLGQSVSYMLRRDNIGDMRTNASPVLQAQNGTWFVSSVGQNLFYDKRDSSVEPTSGYFAGLGNDLAGLGGNVRYLKNAARAGIYLPLDDDKKFVLALKSSAGVMTGLGKTTRVVDRYELGGDSLRGFSDGGIGPRDRTTRDAVGGLLYYKGTAEIAFPLGLPPEIGVKGNIFTDVGAVWNADKVPAGVTIVADNARPRIGAGAGISWKSPFGLIGVYYAPFVHGDKFDRKQRFNVTFGSQF